MGDERIAKVQAGARNAGAAAVVVGLSSNLRYLAGFTDEPGERMLLLIIPQDDEPTLIVPELYADQVRGHCPDIPMLVWADGQDPAAHVATVAAELGDRPGRVLVDDSLWAAMLLPIQRAFAGREIGLASEVMTPLRMRKGKAEVDAMVRAGAIADRALEAALSQPILGLTELELAGRLEAAMLAGGAGGIAFETLVASGPNSGLPHYRAGNRRIESGDVVILDYGCRVDGYCSDMTRTVVCGRPTDEVLSAYDAVRAGHAAAVDRIHVGVEAEEIDRAARRVLTEAGFGEAFSHRTGHGIGLDVHEPPYIVEGNSMALDVGMAFSIEPGAYFPGAFGIRLEDVVVVGEEGARSMTDAPRELRSVE